MRWCGLCLQQHHLRSIVPARFQDKPFDLLQITDNYSEERACLTCKGVAESAQIVNFMPRESLSVKTETKVDETHKQQEVDHTQEFPDFSGRKFVFFLV
jgi:hypothetical protein